MKKYILLFFFLSVLPVSAHVLKTDGDMGAVMHVSPDDDPVVGQVSDFFFDVKDKSNRFSWSDCTCSFLVRFDGNQIYSGQSSEAGASYTFPKKGIYSIELSGVSKSNRFQTFHLIYDMRVDRENKSAQQKPVTLWQRIVEWLQHLFRG